VCSKLRLDPKVRKQFLELTRRWLLLAHGYTAYWRGRAFEAAGQFDEMKGQYDPLSHRLLRPAGASSNWYERMLCVPHHDRRRRGPSSDLLRAADMLYAIGELDLVLTFVSDVAETSSDAVTLRALGELTARHDDAQAMLILGKTALARGLGMERYAFPEIGVPAYSPVAPPNW
jgi:soluble lytic murein transglycosylase